jgi:hypothetical protein
MQGITSLEIGIPIIQQNGKSSTPLENGFSENGRDSSACGMGIVLFVEKFPQIWGIP